MKISTHLKTVALMAAIAVPVGGYAETTKCEQVADAVRTAIAKEPQKVLLIVEDNMVANESCACEIVKAAIQASHANAELIQQIVLTATHVAPKLSAVIADCASSLAPDHSKDVRDSVKQAIGVQPAGGPDSTPGTETTGAANGDYSAPTNLHGIYLIQPSTGGFTTSTTGSSTDKNCDCPTTKVTVVSKRTRVRHTVAQSPSSANQGP